MRAFALPFAAAAFALSLAGCGTSGSPDNGTDAGAGTADAGTPAPDAGNDTPDAGGTASAHTFTETYALFGPRCGSCHAPGSQEPSLDLSTKEAAYASMVGKPANGPICGSTHTLVVAGNSADSLVYQKLTGTAGCGLRMPYGPESGPARPKAFTADELAIVAGWIDAGAKND